MRLLPAGVIVLEKISELLGCPLQIGKGALRDGVILDLLNGALDASSRPLLRGHARARWRRPAGFPGWSADEPYGDRGGEDRRGPGRPS